MLKWWYSDKQTNRTLDCEHGVKTERDVSLTQVYGRASQVMSDSTCLFTLSELRHILFRHERARLIPWTVLHSGRRLVLLSFWSIFFFFFYWDFFYPHFFSRFWGIIYLLTDSVEQTPSWEVCQLAKKLRTLHGSWKFITACTTARYFALSWARLFQFTASHPVF